MPLLDQGPRQLAQVVLRALSVTQDTLPSPSLLTFFFDVLYQAGFRTEGGRPVAGSVLWQDPHRPPYPPTPGSFLALTPPVPFNVNRFAALAAMADPSATALLVFPDGGGQPLIHGLWNSPDTEPDTLPPGAFRAFLHGPARITVDAAPDFQVALRQNTLITHAPDVLRQGPVRARVLAGLGDLLPRLRAQLPPSVADSRLLETQAVRLPDGIVLFDDDDWAETLPRVWIDALTRLLRQVAAGDRGGAVLVTPRPDPALSHAADYPHLRLCLEQGCVSALAHYLQSAQALSESPVPLPQRPPAALDLPHPAALAGAIGRAPDVRQATALLAGTAHGDGLLLLTPLLEGRGFGGSPEGGTLPPEVFLAETVLGSTDSLTAVPAQSFGPRAQALIRQCAGDPEAVGFFVTRDGALRSVLWEEGRVLVWNHVRLHHEWSR